MDDELRITDVSGPFREPREPVLSYDYAIHRTIWPTPHAVRVKLSVPGPLAHLFPRLEAWVLAEQVGLRDEIKRTIGLSV